ncbi:beta-lactamase/transpeptidase-like protein [Aspergillus undulatus]|uniref:beta-lactamase/transpeptidase-like protein n=1 Tax=Aspergillus undulatus TaxID=1810928 RepID=UPI003CCDDC82
MWLLRIIAVVALIPLGLCLSQEQDQVPLRYGHQHDSTDTDNIDNNPLDEFFNRKVDWALEHYHIPGLAISIVQNGTTFAKGYGTSNLTASTPTAPSTLFFGGSTTKAHIAAAITLLVDDNDLYPHVQWNTPVHELLPDFTLSDTSYTAQVTIADMLSHRTGLPRHDFVLMQNLTKRDVLHKLRYLPLTRPIRSGFQYCNLMYIVAGYLVETVTGKALEVFLKENLWGVLGMNGTFFDLDAARNSGFTVSEGYWFDNTTGKPEGEIRSTGNTYNPSLTGAGNILTSASDYAKWMAALLPSPGHPSEGPISVNGYNALFGAHSIVTQWPYTPYTSPHLYGLGWMLQSYRGETIISHDGAQDGFGAAVYLLPNRGFGVSILGNNMVGTGAAAPILVFELVDRLLRVEEGERFDWAGVIDSGLQTGKLTNETLDALYPHLPERDSLLPLPLNLSSYSGLYSHPAYPTLNISSSCPSPLSSPSQNNPNPPSKWKWTGARLCGSFGDTIPLTSDMDLVFDFIHVTGTYWVLVMELGGMADAIRVEFRIGPEGAVREVGVEFEGAMREDAGKIWFGKDGEDENEKNE